jgi:hypothetical membrane protein
MILGVVATLIYVLHVVIGGFLWKNYSHLQQPISDLTATGAPNRTLLLTLTTVYGIMVFLFAISFTFLERKKHSKYFIWGGICFILMHLISIVYGLFPEDLPGSEVTFSGRMHIIITILIVPFTILSPLLIGLGLLKEKEWKSFAIYSIITSLVIVILGATSGIFYANKFPYFGIVERLNIGSLQLWTFIFSIHLFLAIQKPEKGTNA